MSATQERCTHCFEFKPLRSDLCKDCLDKCCQACYLVVETGLDDNDECERCAEVRACSWEPDYDCETAGERATKAYEGKYGVNGSHRR